MRCDASDDCVGSCESAASDAPLGGPADDCAPAPPTSAIAASAATAELAKRSAALLIEEVQVLGVDRDRHAVAETQLHVRRERGDEVRPRPDDARLVLARELVRVGGPPCPRLARVPPEGPPPLGPRCLAGLVVGPHLRP